MSADDFATSARLLSEGKTIKKDGRLDEAIELLARAVEAKMNEEGSEISASLAEYLIEYADSLLVKEEANSQEILRPQASNASESDDEGTTRRLDCGIFDAAPPVDAAEEEEVLSDLQLAWESFEHARLCVAEFKEGSQQKMKDLSFIHCRLGDIQALQDQFSASIADYAESVRYALEADHPGRKVAGLLVSLSQTIQAFMTSEEIKSETFNEIEFVEKFQKLFHDVVVKYECSPLTRSGNGVALVAREGFLLANSLLNQVQSTDPSVDLSPTISELEACADDCLNQQSEISAARVIVPGVTSAGFARPSGSQSSSNIVTVSVKRKVVSGETSDSTSENPKKAKEINIDRADKAKLVD